MLKLNIRWVIILALLCFILVPQELKATITQAEYFFNTDDNGPGNNLFLSVTETDGVATATGTNLPLGGLGSGIHTISSRLYDDQYGWGTSLGRPFLVTSTEIEHEITAAEYFFDTDDNGPGSNTALSLSISDGTATATGMNLATDGLTAGVHIISSRFFATNYGWGPTQGYPFLITHETTDYVISAAEYFFDDNDNGLGQNTALSLSLDNGVATASGSNLATDGLGQGLHIVYTRMYADNHGWGAPRGYPFLITGSSNSNTITAAEYFLDTDPGIGNGTALTLGGSETEVSVNQDFDLSDASPGLHALFVRFYSPEAGWGPKTSAFFLVEDPGLTLFIQSAQYFIGDRPDNSEIITVDSPIDGNYDELSEALNLTNVNIPDGASGLQSVGVRFQRSDGAWGAWRTSQILIEDEDSLYSISGAEYFVDTDPGEGSGQAIEAPLDGSFDEKEEEFDFPVPCEGLSEGGHVAYLRLQRSDGNWGAPRGTYFIVSEDAQPTIAGAEYFTNPGTPEGGGIAFTPLDGAFNTTEEDVSAVANMASLNAQTPGNYTLYSRFMNSRGEWGPTNSQPFTVQIRPQISTNTDTLEFGSLFTGDTRSLSFSISNIGDADLIVNDLTFSDAAYTSDWSSGTITPLGTETINIIFAPLDPAGNHGATLTIGNNDAEKVIELRGVGLDTAPIMTVSQDSLSFGTVSVSSVANLSIRVDNSGNEDLLLSGATSTDPAFSASIPNFTVVPDDYVDISINFAPTELVDKTYTDTLYLLSNDTYFPSYPIYVTGMASVVPVPDIQVSVESLDFGNIKLEDGPVNLSFMIHNSGTEVLNISSSSMDESAFSSNLDASSAIDPSTSKSVTVAFTPTESRRYSGTFILYNDDPDSPELQIDLSGSSVFPDMEIGIHTFAFGEVGVTSSDFREFTIENIGSDTLKIQSFAKEEAIDSVVTITPGAYNIAPDRSKSFVLNFAPPEPIEYDGMVIIMSNDENDTLYVSGSGLDDEAPEIAFDPGDLEDVGTSENNPINISVPITDNNQVSWVRLYFRQGGNTTYDSTDMELEAGQYQGNIPAAYVRNRGVEYFIKAFDGANEVVLPETAPEIPAIIRVRIPFLPPFTFTAETYGMISVPSDLDAKNVRANLEGDIGEYDVNAWRLFRWINGNYVELSDNDNFSFEPGNAYWLITANQEVITLDSSTSVKTNEEYLISLDQGWNQVGTPYYFSVSWADVYAANPGIVQGFAYEWIEDEWVPATIMQPFGGYFISTPSGGNILRVPPTEYVQGVAKTSGHPFTLRDEEWVLQISAQNEGSRDIYNYVGVLNDAQTGLDLRDQPKPPAMYNDRIQLFSEQSEWGEQSGRYAGDFRAPDPSGHYWDLTLKTGATAEDIYLSLDEIGDLPDAFDIRVLNMDLRYELAADHSKFYRQRYYKENATYRMRIAIGTEDFLAKHDEGITLAPDQFRLAQNFPNPFNGETRIQYDIPEPTDLQVMIYDMTGRQIRQLIRSGAHPVGYHEVSWDGTNDQGQRVASGIYLIRFQSPEFHATRKMVLLK